MSEVHLYSKIVDNGATSSIEKHAVNSAIPKPTSVDKKRKWSPGLSAQEAALKKQARDEAYLQTIDEQNRPVLHVQAKTVFKDLATADGLTGLAAQNKVFRSTQDAKPRSPDHPPARLAADLTPKLALLANPKPNPLAQETVSKIEGVEVLPKGFLDLDPILFKDEYRFDSKADEDLFVKEQRKIRAKRMKQYALKNHEKERNVTIFVVEDKKNQILEYLDNWFEKTRRLMNRTEIEYVAKTLQTDPDGLQQIQEAYYQKLKIIKSKLFDKELVRNQEISKVKGDVVPESMKQYFLTNPTDNYQNAEAKINTGVGAGSDAYLSKYNKLLHSRKLEPGHKLVKNVTAKVKPLSSDDHLQGIGMRFLQALERTELPMTGGAEDRPALVQSTIYEPLSQSQTKAAKAGSAKHVPSQFDRDINEVLQRMLKASQVIPADAKHAPMQTGNQLDTHDYMVESTRMADLLTDLNKNPEAYKREHNLLLSEIMTPQEALNIGSLQSPKRAADDLLFRSVDPSKTTVSVLKPSNKCNNPIRCTTVYKNDKGKSVMIQRLKPLLFRNEFIYQTVIDAVDTNNVRTIVIQTRKENGEPIADQLIDLNVGGNFFDSYLVESIDDAEVHIVTRNENKVTVASAQVSEDESLSALKMLKVFEGKSYCIDEIYTTNLPENEFKRTHRLRPVIVGGEVYRQQVEELIEAKNKKTVSVHTFNSENLELSQVRGDSNLIQTSNYSKIESDQVDFEGSRRIVLLTKNDINEVLAKQTFMSNIDASLMEQGCNQLLEEVEYEDGQKQITVGFRNSRGMVFSHRKVTGDGFEDEYYIELKNDFVADGQRHIVFVAKTFDGELLVEKMYNPAIGADITIGYYEDMLRELKEEIGRLYIKPSKKYRFHEFVTFSLVRFELRYLEEQKRLSCRAIDQRDAILVEKLFDAPKDSHRDQKLLDELISKMEAELQALGLGGLKRRRFKADFHKTHTVLNQPLDKTAGPVPADSHLNYSYYKSPTGVDMTLADSQVIASNPLPRFSKIPRSYFRNLQKELAISEETVADYVEAVQKAQAGRRQHKGTEEQKYIPIRAPKEHKPIVKSTAKEPESAKLVKSAFGSTIREPDDKAKVKKAAETVSSKAGAKVPEERKKTPVKTPAAESRQQPADKPVDSPRIEQPPVSTAALEADAKPAE